MYIIIIREKGKRNLQRIQQNLLVKVMHKKAYGAIKVPGASLQPLYASFAKQNKQPFFFVQKDMVNATYSIHISKNLKLEKGNFKVRNLRLRIMLSSIQLETQRSDLLCYEKEKAFCKESRQ